MAFLVVFAGVAVFFAISDILITNRRDDTHAPVRSSAVAACWLDDRNELMVSAFRLMAFTAPAAVVFVAEVTAHTRPAFHAFRTLADFWNMASAAFASASATSDPWQLQQFICWHPSSPQQITAVTT